MRARKKVIIFLITYIFFFIVNIAFHISMSRGYLHPESERMLLSYTDSRSLPQKIFDVNQTDWGNYQARELSYFVDYLDYNFIAWCLRHGITHFFSLSNYVGILLVCMMLFVFCSKYLKLDIQTTSLLLTLFLTSSSMILSGLVFRSAKIGVTVLLAGLFLVIYKQYKGIQGKNIKEYFLIFILSLSATLFDRQGLFLIGALIVFLLILPYQKSCTRGITIGILLTSVILNSIYNYFIGPFLICKMNGYYPSFDFQNIELLNAVIRSPDYVTNGLYLYYCNVKYVLGNDNILLVLLFLFYFVIHPVFRLNIRDLNSYIKSKYLRPERFVVAGSLLIVLMNSIMFIKHPPLIWTDVQRSYYWMPVSILIILVLSLIIYRLRDIYNAKIINCILLLLTGCNILAIPENFKVIYSGHLKQSIKEYNEEITPFIKQSHNSVYFNLPEKYKDRAIYKFIQRDIIQKQNTSGQNF